MSKTTNDNKIKAFLQKVDEKRKELGAKPKAKWTTNALFTWRDGGKTNLNTVKDEQVLVQALGELVQAREARKTAATMLGVAEPEFSHDGYTLEEWRDDFILRIQLLTYDKKKKELTALEKKLNTLMSEDARTERELDDIASLLA